MLDAGGFIYRLSAILRGAPEIVRIARFFFLLLLLHFP
jgi:hypothetical protein